MPQLLTSNKREERDDDNDDDMFLRSFSKSPLKKKEKKKEKRRFNAIAIGTFDLVDLSWTSMSRSRNVKILFMTRAE